MLKSEEKPIGYHVNIPLSFGGSNLGKTLK
jgi:hypothetical protein